MPVTLRPDVLGLGWGGGGGGGGGGGVIELWHSDHLGTVKGHML